MARQAPLPGVPPPAGPTKVYRVRGIARDLQRAARARAVAEGTTLGTVLVRALTEYAAGRWTPGPDGDARPSARP